jgi:ATP-dependent helicase/nuclease subunit A
MCKKMTDTYLDITKSVMISSPAGSGKTEKLARRYIALLGSGVDVERILAITFTEKAAAEMKQRILSILSNENKELFHMLLNKIPLMRVSTIHSFCGTLIRRFSFEASINANYTVQDTIDSLISWEEVLYEIMMDAGREADEKEFLLQSLSEKGFKGLAYLKAVIDKLFEKLPFSLEADTPLLPGPVLDVSPVDELIRWPGAAEAIQDYDTLFGEEALSGMISAEKFFLTKGRAPRVRVPDGLKGIKDYKKWSLKMYSYWVLIHKAEHSERACRIKEIFNRCFSRYCERKNMRGNLDFSDLEFIAYKLLTENPDWANILYAFDEKTDHILVDEFQDTNMFQWTVIDKLTEEWRSGLGAKREGGVKPTIFLVGDEKQSIYFFRGANVGIFRNAREKLGDWLKGEFSFEAAKENFRSRPAIIDFTNHVFSKIMGIDRQDGSPREDKQSWYTQYSSFEARRRADSERGRVELILLEDEEGTAGETREKEADIIARRVRTLVGHYQITEKKSSQQKTCTYRDIALLLRKRTHLKRYEEAFRRHGVPFIVVKGIGFYQEPEVAMLRALVYFLSDARDDYSLYTMLKSPLFLMDERAIIRAAGGVDRNMSGLGNDCLFLRLKSDKHSEGVVTMLEGWMSRIPSTPLAEVIEEALVQTKAWKYFYEPQRKANVRKFIKLVEDLEADGKSLVKIRDFLEITYSKADEPKANVNTEGMNAVKIMTIHGAKGLEFPVVFIPGLDESARAMTDDCLVYENNGKFCFKYEPDAVMRKGDADFRLHEKKSEEEQKRLFYVAVTRAEEALFLTGKWHENNRGFLGYLTEGLGLERTETGFSTTSPGSERIEGFELMTEKDVYDRYNETPKPEAPKYIHPLPDVIPLEIKRPTVWKAVTEVVNIRRRHGKDWLMLGDIFHRIFEDVSQGNIAEQEIIERANKLLSLKGITKNRIERLMPIIKADISLLKRKGIWQDVIMPRKDSFAELPFILEAENVVYKGRIDRIVKDNGVYRVFDYKTFPVYDNEVGYLLREYSSQLAIYKKAVEKLFKIKEVRSFIIFTHIGKIQEVI